MNQRKLASGRPSGTDGSDYSYRMVVDSRYQKVAKGKSRLCALIVAQVIIHLGGAAYLFILTSRGDTPNKLAILSVIASLISLFIGELGRRRSRANLLKVYIMISSLALVLRCVNISHTIEAIWDPSNWQTQKIEVFEAIRISIGALLQIFTIGTVTSLVGNMAPPKRAS